MPEFIEEVTISFDCYCYECGAGICNSCDADNRNRKLTIELCPICKKAYEDTIDSLEYEIEELKEKIKNLKNNII